MNVYQVPAGVEQRIENTFLAQSLKNLWNLSEFPYFFLEKEQKRMMKKSTVEIDALSELRKSLIN